MDEFLDILLLRTWWSYRRDFDLPISAAYHWFNIAEGVAWLVFAGLVANRYLEHRHTQLELVYAMLFLTFAITDFREAYVQQSWLIWLKLINLIGLLWMRRIVMARYYPSAKVF